MNPSGKINLSKSKYKKSGERIVPRSFYILPLQSPVRGEKFVVCRDVIRAEANPLRCFRKIMRGA